MAGLGIQAGAGALGELTGAQDKTAARNLLRRIMEGYQGIPEPELRAIEAELLGPSEAGQVRADPAMREAQLNVLNKLRGIEESGGMTLEDQATLNKVLGQTARQESAGRAQIANQMQARGVANSGADLAMQLQNQQASAERANQTGLDVAGQAQKRALQAMMSRGQMAGQMRGQDFGEQMSAAQARDMFSKINHESRSRAQYYNANIPQQQFNNKMTKQSGVSTAMGGVVKDHQAAAKDAQQLAGGLGVAGYEAFKAFGEDDKDDDK